MGIDTLSFKVISILLIFLTAAFAGIYPFKAKAEKKVKLSIGEALACGVFLGAGLLHMLSDATQDFLAAKIDYPISFLLAGAAYLGLLLLELKSSKVIDSASDNEFKFAVLSTVVLSVHSLIAGAALGLSQSWSFIVLLFAILAHKWAASFSLSVQINKTSASFFARLSLFSIFAVMTPLGIIIGSLVEHFLTYYPLIEPSFNAFAAGTFIYLGTIHGLRRSFLITECTDKEHFSAVTFGFVLMAVIAFFV